MATYVIPDTHGCLNTLRFLLEDKLLVSKGDSLYFLGDYIDRWHKGAHVVDYLVKLKDQGFSINALRGNHEQMLLDSILDPIAFKDWMLNTGGSTLKSYRDFLGSDFDFPFDIPDSHLQFYSDLPHHLMVDRFILTHGGINYKINDPFSDTTSLLWKRPEAVPSDFMPNSLFIHGHTPTPLDVIKEQVANPNARIISLDAGCVYAGRYNGVGYLVALEIETMKLSWVYNMDREI
jgi:serine/threonine protein phosphatase 1